jgi:hypothetical protein
MGAGEHSKLNTKLKNSIFYMAEAQAIKREHEGDSDEESRPQRSAKRQQRYCPYLDTINRHVLDFDFEKVCSVTNAHLNVYACLVCGKYFQGPPPPSISV